MFVVNYELSGITKYSWPGMKKTARSDFKQQGITPMESGGQRIVYDPVRTRFTRSRLGGLGSELRNPDNQP